MSFKQVQTINQNTVFFVEQHIYKYIGDMWKYVISATLKKSKLKQTNMGCEVKLQTFLKVMIINILPAKNCEHLFKFMS